MIVKKLGKSQTTLTAEHIVTIRKRIYQKRGNEKRDRNTRQIAVYKEFGTVSNPPEPFLAPALANNLQPAIEAMAASLQSDLFKAGA